MPSIDLIKASDGTGPAALMTIQSPRAPLSSTITVDTLVGVPQKFIATMGTPDLVTGIISDATATDFVGHIDGANLEIDSICPGFTDLGSDVGDVVVIKPTSYWANEIAQLLGVNFNDNGTLKDEIIKSNNFEPGAVDTPALGQSVVTPAKWTNPYVFGVYRNAPQNTGNATSVKVNYDTVLFDPNSNFSNGTYTAPVDGYYQFSASVKFSIASVGIIILFVNGSERLRGVDYRFNAGNSATVFSGLTKLEEGDTVEIYVTDDAASAITVGEQTCWFNGFLVSRY